MAIQPHQADQPTNSERHDDDYVGDGSGAADANSSLSISAVVIGLIVLVASVVLLVAAIAPLCRYRKNGFQWPHAARGRSNGGAGESSTPTSAVNVLASSSTTQRLIGT